MQEGWCIFEDEYYEYIYEMICKDIDTNGYCDFTKEHIQYATSADNFDNTVKRYTHKVRFYYAD